ncbi:MAG TPA: hypothetical protein VGM90_29635 [Kofleriaceae bacterium]|jgi:hypothetical protein
MRTYVAAALALMLGASPAIGDSHVRYVVHGAAKALTTGAKTAEIPRPARPINLRLDVARSHKAPPPVLRVDFPALRPTDDEPSAFNSVSTSLYQQLPSTQTDSGVRIITTPQIIRSADGRVLGAGLTANF